MEGGGDLVAVAHGYRCVQGDEGLDAGAVASMRGARMKVRGTGSEAVWRCCSSSPSRLRRRLLRGFSVPSAPSSQRPSAWKLPELAAVGGAR